MSERHMKILDERVVYGVAGPGCQRSGRSLRMRFWVLPLSSVGEITLKLYSALSYSQNNANELKTGAPGRFDRHRLVASPRSGACRRRCRRFGFPVRAGKTPSSNGMPRSRAETWIQARAAHGPERASWLRRGSPGLDSGPLGRPLFRRCTALSATRSPPLAQTWHSKIEIRDQNRK